MMAWQRTATTHPSRAIYEGASSSARDCGLPLNALHRRVMLACPLHPLFTQPVAQASLLLVHNGQLPLQSARLSDALPGNDALPAVPKHINGRPNTHMPGRSAAAVTVVVAVISA